MTSARWPDDDLGDRLDLDGVCFVCNEPDAPWDNDGGVYVHEECIDDPEAAA